jgi:hypothetical protein
MTGRLRLTSHAAYARGMTPEQLGAAAAVFLTVLVGGLGLIVVFGIKLWRGTDDVISALRDALGAGAEKDDGPEHRPKTGSFQAVVREEVDRVEVNLDRRFDRMDRAIADLGERQAAVEAATHSQGDLLAKLSRSHDTVVRRTNEHSAALNIKGADRSMTRGAIQG